jgi:hypothetical protein
MSTEKNNLLIATLSAGMVGIGDAIGAENREDLMLAARPDGVIVKPDAPLVPTDATYINEALDAQLPFVAATFTQHGDHRTAYLFVYSRRDTDSMTEFRPAEFGLSGDVWVYEPATQTATKITADTVWRVDLKRHGTAFFVIAPEGRARLAFFGDAGKFVSTGKKRIAVIEESRGKLAVTITFAAGEQGVRLFGYAKRAPEVAAQQGSVADFSFNPASGRFEFTAAPAAGVTDGLPGHDPIQQACVTITAR